MLGILTEETARGGTNRKGHWGQIPPNAREW